MTTMIFILRPRLIVGANIAIHNSLVNPACDFVCGTTPIELRHTALNA